MEHRYRGAYLQILFSLRACCMWPSRRFEHAAPTKNWTNSWIYCLVTCIKHSKLETVSNKWPNSVPKRTLWEESDEIPTSKAKLSWVFWGCTSCLKMEQLLKNVIGTQYLLQSKTSAWRDPIFIPLKHTSSKLALKTQLLIQNILLAKQNYECRN